MTSDPTPTIVVTGANGLVGRALLERMKDREEKVIAITRYKVDLPIKRVIVAPLDHATAQAALKGADVVIHLAGILFPIGKDTYQKGNLEATALVANAVKAGQVKRVLFLSYVGAHEESKNAFLRTKAIAEKFLMSTTKETVIFRCTHMVGTPQSPGPMARSLLAKPGKKANVMGTGRQRVAPLYVGDVVSALLAAIKNGTPGTYDLAGPEQMSMDELVQLVNRNPGVPIKHLPDRYARILGALLPWLPWPFVDVTLQDSVGSSFRAISTFGLKLTSLKPLWK